MLCKHLFIGMLICLRSFCSLILKYQIIFAAVRTHINDNLIARLHIGNGQISSACTAGTVTVIHTVRHITITKIRGGVAARTVILCSDAGIQTVIGIHGDCQVTKGCRTVCCKFTVCTEIFISIPACSCNVVCILCGIRLLYSAKVPNINFSVVCRKSRCRHTKTGTGHDKGKCKPCCQKTTQ